MSNSRKIHNWFGMVLVTAFLLSAGLASAMAPEGTKIMCKMGSGVAQLRWAYVEVFQDKCWRYVTVDRPAAPDVDTCRAVARSLGCEYVIDID